MSTWVQLLFAGAGHFIWHWGIGVGCIIILLLAAYFTTAIPLIGPWLSKIRIDLLWAAGALALLLAGEYIGAKDEEARCVAKTVVIEKVVRGAVSRAHSSPAAHDRFDSPNN